MHFAKYVSSFLGALTIISQTIAKPLENGVVERQTVTAMAILTNLENSVSSVLPQLSKCICCYKVLITYVFDPSDYGADGEHYT